MLFRSSCLLVVCLISLGVDASCPNNNLVSAAYARSVLIHDNQLQLHFTLDGSFLCGLLEFTAANQNSPGNWAGFGVTNTGDMVLSGPITLEQIQVSSSSGMTARTATAKNVANVLALPVNPLTNVSTLFAGTTLLGAFRIPLAYGEVQFSASEPTSVVWAWSNTQGPLLIGGELPAQHSQRGQGCLDLSNGDYSNEPCVSGTNIRTPALAAATSLLCVFLF